MDVVCWWIVVFVHPVDTHQRPSSSSKVERVRRMLCWIVDNDHWTMTVHVPTVMMRLIYAQRLDHAAPEAH